MKNHLLLSNIFIWSFTCSVLLMTQPTYGDIHTDPAETVMAFNKAMTDGKLVDLLDTFANGSIQYTVKASHMGQTPDGLTTDSKRYWSMIAPVIFSSTKSYSRKAEIIDIRKTDTMATVWAEVETNSQRMSGGSQKNNFKEIYVLIQTSSGWKIAGIMDTKKLSTLKTSSK